MSTTVALVGAGFMGRMHGAVYQALPNANLVTVYDPNPEKARSVAESHQARVADSFDEILADSSIQVVDICTPTPSHADLAIRAIEADKDVFCEKPMARTSAEARSMIEAAERHGRALMIGHCIRFWPEYETLANLVHSGELGQLQSLNLTRYGEFPHWSTDGWLGEEPLSGGAAMDMHIHDTDYALSLLGEPSSIVSHGTVDGRGVSQIFTTMKFGPTVVHAEGGWNLPSHTPFKMSFRAIFENGAAIFDGGPLTIYRPGQGPVQPEVASMDAGNVGGNISNLGGYYFELAYFYDCLNRGLPCDRCTPQSALRSLETVEREIDLVKQAR